MAVSPDHRDRARDRRERTRSRSPSHRHRDREYARDRGRDDRREKERERREDLKRHRSRSRSPHDRSRRSRRERSRSRERERDRDRARDRDRERKGVRFSDDIHGRGDERDREDRGHSRGRSERKSKTPERREEKAEDEELKPETKKAEPLSLEDLLKKKKEEEAALAKPVFLTKKQREELALKKRQEEVANQRARIDAMRRVNEQTAQEMRRDKEDTGRPPRRHEEPRERERRKNMSQEEIDRLKELESIKKQYLGQEKVKKRVVKPSEKFKFNFDWENSEDTSKDLNPLYNNLHEAPLLFGRGMRAGADRREQKKQAALHEKELLSKMRNGKEMTKEELERERAAAERADKYDRNDMRVDTHWSTKKLADMTERDWRIFREDFNISYRGSNPPLPIRNWDECPLPKSLRKAIEKMGYKKPSPIQMAGIPVGLQQRDVIGLAETGSGKTAAFVLPMLVYIQKQPPMTEEIEAEGPYALVMAPTRELVMQIDEETRKLAEYTGFRVTHVVGGQSIEEQGFKLRRGCEIVVATPGRMLDCLERHYAVLNQCNYVVLDEADRMIDMGFEPQVLGVMDAMPSTNLKPESDDVRLEGDKVYRTTYMFSATMPPAVERIARKYLRRPVIVQIGSTGRATDNVTQHVKMLTGKGPSLDQQKLSLLEDALYEADERRAIVFVNTRAHCDTVTRTLEQAGYMCCVLHGGKAQDLREISLDGFKNGKYNVLVATDVAGRGIDVQDVAIVVNYDMPGTIEAYTHRIGRTGRAGKKGVAVSFLTGADTDLYFDLKNLLQASKQFVPHELAHHEAAKQDPKAIGGRKRDEKLFARTD